jgi:drug/metabolite transporter (DMT)-like permease
MLLANKYLVAMVLAMVGWGVASPIGDIAIDFIDPISFFVIEIVSGLFLFFIVALVVPSLRKAIRQVPWRIALPFGLIQPGIAYLLGNIGWQYGTVTTGVILMSSEVIFLAIGGALFLREKLNLWSSIALFIGVTGAIIVGVAGQSSNPETAGQTVVILGFTFSAGMVGAAAFLGVGLCGGIYGLLMRRLKSDVNTIALTLGQMTSASVLSVVVLLATQTDIPTPQSVGPYFYMAVLGGIVGTTLPFLLFNFAAPKLTTKQTALTLNIIPVVAILSGAVVGRGLPVGAQYVGIVLVLISLLALESGHDEETDSALTSPAFPKS